MLSQMCDICLRMQTYWSHICDIYLTQIVVASQICDNGPIRDIYIYIYSYWCLALTYFSNDDSLSVDFSHQHFPYPTFLKIYKTVQVLIAKHVFFSIWTFSQNKI